MVEFIRDLDSETEESVCESSRKELTRDRPARPRDYGLCEGPLLGQPTSRVQCWFCKFQERAYKTEVAVQVYFMLTLLKI